MPRIPGELCQLWRPDERGRVPTASETPAATVCHAAPAFAPGTYYFLSNARGGTVMDLSGADSTSIIGYPKHGGPNQQWEFIPCGHGCFIRGAPPYSGLYLALDCGGARDGAPVVASEHPVAWDVEKTDAGIIISWPNSQFVFDLANWGDKAPCTKIQLKSLIPGELCQLWCSTEVATACK
ncbi:hypothetical protein LXA43DRAFT_205483 [Ganoderma leucocontextum]|nr:hypothetical protein LXA43DRAFT_205483 [Ganoderma leucocontextum]